jgi:sulfoxide reductase heme-binding subunit YedZ
MANLLRQVDIPGDSEADLAPLVEGGKWAVRFLLFSLAMTPLNTLFGWRSAIKLRKPAGLWAFGFAVLHFAVYVLDTGRDWLNYPIPDYYAALGVVALIILAAMAATSTRWAMKRMGKNWKRLHRFVYAAGVIGIVHGLLESASSKRVFVYDPRTIEEVWIYLFALVVLLAARIPVVRASIADLRHRRRKSGKPQPSANISG